MTWYARIRSWLTGIVRRDRIEREMSDELAFHIEARAADLARRGLPPAEAVRQARIEFGAAERYKDECRESRGLRLINELRADLLYAARGLRRSPGFAVIVVLSLALGVGANTAMFSIVNGVLLRPLPYRDADRLVAIEEEVPESVRGMKRFGVPAVNAVLHLDSLRSFEDVLAMDYATYQLIDTADPQDLSAGWVTANFCAMLGVQPVIGRCFDAEEQAHQAQVTILSYELWQRQFRGDASVLGRGVTLKDGSGNKSVTVIGVLPPKFRHVSGWQADLLMPISESSNFRSRDSSWNPSVTIARLKPRVSIQQAQTELLALQRQMYPTAYESAGGREIRILSLPDFLAIRVRSGLAILLGIVALVLLITCVNVANLLLSRGAARVREIAVRASLGAGRFRICRQLFTEALTLAAGGGALGLLTAYWILRGVKALKFRLLPRVEEIEIDFTVLAFTAIVSILSGVLFGLLPALRLSRVDLADAMKSGGAGAMGGRRQQRVMSGLVVFEVGLCIVAMIGAGLLVNTFLRLQRVEPGFRPTKVLVASLNGTPLFGEILTRVRAIPGVEATALTNHPPPQNILAIQQFNGTQHANSRVVSTQYFQAMSIPLLRGRTFNEHDLANSRRVVVISESMARRYWPNGDALGQTILLKARKEQPAEIVGIVGDVRQTGLRRKPDDLLYFVYTQADRDPQAIIVKTRGEPAELVSTLKQEIRSIDRNQTFRRVFTMTELLAGDIAEPRFYMILLGSYGLLALGLTTLGIGGLVAYSVSRRTQEIGLRISFGATRSSLHRMFAGGSLKLIAAGLVIGIPASLAVTRFTRTLLYEVTPSDPATFTVVALVLTGVSLVASAGAALRATSIEPTVVLRHE